jgi:hypothetical protein
MSILSKSEVQSLLGKKHVSKLYEYKLKSIIKKKIANLIEKEIPLISFLISNFSNITEFRKDNPTAQEATKKLLSPVKHCGLSSRKHRIQIPILAF